MPARHGRLWTLQLHLQLKRILLVAHSADRLDHEEPSRRLS